MNTLQTIRQFTFTTALAAAALVAPAIQAADECVHEAAAIATRDNAVASLGQMVVTASRVASLGVLVVSAPRGTNAEFADLGTMTVTAPSHGGVIVAGRATSRSWN